MICHICKSSLLYTNAHETGNIGVYLCETCKKKIDNSPGVRMCDNCGTIFNSNSVSAMCPECLYKLGDNTAQKPKPGIMPEKIWKEKRFDELKECIKRKLDANENILPDWIVEFDKLLRELHFDSKGNFFDKFI
jgi:hypothetical protein